MNLTARKALLIAALSLAGCATPAGSFNDTHGVMPAASLEKPSPKLPSELLYVDGGSGSYPYIEVFNGKEKSPRQKPIYKIAQRSGGRYGLLAVDSDNNLYVVNYLSNGSELDVFPSGETEPAISCLLAQSPTGSYIEGSVLYLTTPEFKIEEYPLPLRDREICPKPAKTLTDQHAKLNGKLFFTVAADGVGDVFDIWQSGASEESIDEFPSRSEKARAYAPLGQSAAFYMTTDAKGNLATSISPNGIGEGDDLAIFPYSSHHPKLYHPIRDGSYFGLAFAEHDTELFAAVDYPATTVEVYAYDPQTHHVGELLRSFSNVWYYAQSIAVFSAD